MPDCATRPRDSIGPKGNYDIPANIDYDIWSGPAEIKPLHRKQFHYDWHWMWDYGNGDLGNQGIHQMDIARWGLNEPNLGTNRSKVMVGDLDMKTPAKRRILRSVCTISRTANAWSLKFEDSRPKSTWMPTVGVIFEGDGGLSCHARAIATLWCSTRDRQATRSKII